MDNYSNDSFNKGELFMTPKIADIRWLEHCMLMTNTLPN